MSNKRPIVKFKNREGKVKVKKMCASYYVDGIWHTFKELHDEIVNDVEWGKYNYDDIVDIVFEHPDRRKN